MTKTRERIESKLEDELAQVAESLIVKGKEQDYLLPDDILETFPEMEAEPDQLLGVIRVFTEMGIEVTDGGKDCEQVELMDDTLVIDMEMADSVPFDDPLRLYLKDPDRPRLVSKISRTRSGIMPISSAISSSVGSRPST